MKKQPWFAAILVLLMLCTISAGAEEIVYAQDAQIKYRAQEALREKYGFSKHDVGMYAPTSIEENKAGQVVVEFLPVVGIYSEQLGTFTVTLSDAGDTVTWSNDGVMTKEMLDAADLSAPVWGAKQVAQVIATDRAYYQLIPKEDGEEYTLEELAAMDALWLESGYVKDSYNTLPKPGDMTEAEAIAFAREAICEAYALDADDFAPDSTSVSLWTYADSDVRRYMVTFVMYAEQPDKFGNTIHLDYGMEFQADTGEEPSFWWGGSEEKELILPEGSLEGKDALVQAFFSYGLFMKLPHEDRAELAPRLTAAGYGSYLNDLKYRAPGENTLPEAEAEAMAHAALAERYGLTEGMLALLSAKCTYVFNGEEEIWSFRLEASEDTWSSAYEAMEGMGYYTVHIAGDAEAKDSKAGSVRYVSWNHDQNDTDISAYDATNFLSAPAWNADILAYVVPHMEAMKPYLHNYDLTLAEEITRDALQADAGAEMWWQAMEPEPGELTEEQAIAIAKEVLHQWYDLPKDSIVWEDEKPDLGLLEGQRCWRVGIWSREAGEEGDYFVAIDPQTGEVLDVLMYAMGNG